MAHTARTAARAEVGFGTPDVVYVVYGIKIVPHLLGAMLFSLTTPEIDGFLDVTSWWGKPVVFQKIALCGRRCSWSSVSAAGSARST